MAQQFELKFPTPGTADDDDRATHFTRITESILTATAAVLLVALAGGRIAPDARAAHGPPGSDDPCRTVRANPIEPTELPALNKPVGELPCALS